MDRAAHAMLTAGVTTVFHPMVYAKTLIQVLNVFCVKLPRLKFRWITDVVVDVHKIARIMM